jgi:hypothetical protein
MPINRKKMTDKELEQIFQKTTEAMHLFAEKPDSLRSFIDALKRENFSEARTSLNASLDRRREEPVADISQVPSDHGKR